MGLKDPIIGSDRAYVRAPHPFLIYSNYSELKAQGFWASEFG